MTDLGQWTTAEPLIKGYPLWLADPDEQKRVAAYQLYEEIYWGVPNAFKLLQRGEENDPIYLPAPRTIVETLHRYMANAMKMVVDPAIGTTNNQKNALLVMDAFLKRERFYSRFNANKREGIFRGDWIFHLYADPTREEGARISIQTADPASVFPIYNELNLDEIIGYHVVEQQEFDGKAAISRLTYRKTTMKGGPSPITMEHNIYEVDKWGGPGMTEDEASVLAAVAPLTTLPQPIDSLPIYWIQNFQQTGTIFGSSELRGMERIIAALNQAITDEELSLAYQGLGFYKSNAGQPINAAGEDTDWEIGPGRVVNLPTGGDYMFDRVNGVSTVAPYMDHLGFLIGQLDQASATPEIAKGRVDVSVAESGISLMLQLGPLLSRATEKEQVVTDVITNLFFDLATRWFPAYERPLAGDLLVTSFIPAYGDKIPVNRKQRFEEIMAMVAAKLVSEKWTRGELTKLGFEFGDEATMLAEILQETAAKGTVEADPFGDRMDQETAGAAE